MTGSPFQSRITFLMIFCLVFGSALIGRAAIVQIIRDPRLEQLSRRQFQSKVLIRPRRGAILDRNGEPLAINTEINSLAANPTKIVNKKTVARLLSKATDVPYSKVLQRLKEKREFIWIKRHIPDGEVNRLKRWQLMDPDGDLIPGLWLVKESKRVYPHKELASHILGDVNVDLEGLEGIELQMNERLRGKVVSVSAIKDALGRPTFIDAVAAKDVQDGEPVSLTIDASLQFEVEEALRTAVRKTNARSGSVIVMNAVNGEILAMANEPSFNPNEKGAPADRRRNRTVTDGFEPGSTLKSVLLASALSHGFKLNDQVWGERGVFHVQGKKISEAEAHEKFEWLSLKKMIKVSSNIGAAKLALKLGSEHYYNSLLGFGFASRTNLGFPGEIPGRVPPRKAWQPLSLANIGFGHGVLVTRLQMTRAYASFINGGWLVQPSLIKSPTDESKTEPPKRVLNEQAARQVVDALQGVIEEGGTGLKAAVDGYLVAGKTGTAQVVDPNTGTYSRSKYIASFIGFPVNVEPKVVIFAGIDEPKGIYYASETAAPLFREVLNAVASRLSLPTTQPIQRVLAQEPSVQHIRVSQAHPAPKSDPAPVPQVELKWAGSTADGAMLWTMPALRGLTAREAIRVLQGNRFHMEVHGSGVVQTQAPSAGEVIAENTTIRLELRDEE